MAIFVSNNENNNEGQKALTTIGFFGGTFDPVHYGHLQTALELKGALALDEMRLMPCHIPAHRQAPGSSAEHRLAMVQLAVQEFPELLVDDRECQSFEPSYTAATLTALRAELGDDVSLVFVMGMDVFLSLPTWGNWQQLLELCHIVVTQRPGWQWQQEHVDTTLASFLAEHQVFDNGVLKEKNSGTILLTAMTPMDVSATSLRDKIEQGVNLNETTPKAVQSYMDQHGLYRV